MPPRTPRYRELSLERRLEAVALLLAHQKNGILERGKLAMVAKKMGVAHSTISRLWKKAVSARNVGKIIPSELRARTPHAL